MRDLDLVAKVVAVSGTDAGVQAVYDRKADAFFAERSILLDAAKRSASPGELMVIDRMFTTAPLALTFRRGDDDFRLLVDRTLSRVYRSGEISGVYTTWFGAPGATTTAFFQWTTLPE
jgi:putrescine:ornithine antiporter